MVNTIPGDKMNQYSKYLILSMLCVFLYPLLHEFGHCFSAHILKVQEINVDIVNMSTAHINTNFYNSLIIGCSGLVFPLLINILRIDVLWYIRINILYLCLVYDLGSLISLIGYHSGYWDICDDMILLSKMCIVKDVYIYLFLIINIILIIFLLKKEGIINKLIII